MTPEDLREAIAFNWMQQIVGGLGMFLMGGAFWKLFDLAAATPSAEVTAWRITYIVMLGFGAVLYAISWVLFHLKQRRISKYFPKGGA